MFKNPVTPKINETNKKSPWNFKHPEYDERSSHFVQAGTNYGVGHRNPVGHASKPKARVPTMPFGRPPTMSVDSSSTAHEKLDFID